MLKRSTRQALDRAREEFVAIQVSVGSLNAQRLAALSNPEVDAAAVLALDRRIADESAKMAVLQQQIENLATRHDQEQADRQAQARRAAVEKIPVLLAVPSLAAQKLEQALSAGVNQLLTLRKAQSDALRSWPDVIERPYAMDFGTDRAIRRIEAAMRAFLAESRLEDRIGRFQEELSGYADAEAAGYAELVDDLRAQSHPEPETEKAA